MSAWENNLRGVYYETIILPAVSPDQINYIDMSRRLEDTSSANIRYENGYSAKNSIQRSIRRPHKRNKIVVTGIDDQWSADLVDMVKFKNDNDSYAFELVAVGVFSLDEATKR